MKPILKFLFAMLYAAFATFVLSSIFNISPAIVFVAIAFTGFVIGKTGNGALLTALAPDLQKALDDLKEALQKSTSKELSDELEKKIKDFEEKHKDALAAQSAINLLKDDLKVIKDEATKQKEAVDKLAKDLSARHLNPEHFNKDSFRDELLKGLQANKEGLSGYKSNRRPISIDLKAAGADMGGGNFTVSPTTARFQVGTDLGQVLQPFPSAHMRNIIPTTPVQGDSVYVVRDSGGNTNAAGVQPGALKPQSDRNFVKVIVPVTKIAHWYRIPDEWLEDLSWLANDISQIGTEELLKVEDAKIISNSTANEFTGLTQNSTAYAAPASLALNVYTPNNYDVLVSSWTEARSLNETPNAHIVNPGDYAGMILAKSTTGEYPFGPNFQMPNVLGVPVYPVTAQTADNFLTMDANLSTIGIRQGVNVRFFDQDQDNAIKNMVTVVIEERIVLVVRRITSVIHGTFTAAKTALLHP
jgi:HK97 family phage major capsid protein